MRKTIQPELHATIAVCESCGATYALRSTAGHLAVEVCANCHPAYTGVERPASAGGRVARFERRRALAAA